MSPNMNESSRSGTMIAILVGVLGGIALLAMTFFDIGLGGLDVDRTGRLSVRINGVSQRMARDAFLPQKGWVLQIQFGDLPVQEMPDEFLVTLRSEHTGATIEIQDRLVFHDGFASFTIPKQLGLTIGLLSIRATFTDSTGQQFEDAQRVRIRSPLGGLPIGVRQVIHFDFSVDHDGDERPDFWQDLEIFGLGSKDQPKLTRYVAEQIEARALARLEAAFDSDQDPNQTGRSRDLVTVYFHPTDDAAALSTRICVGGTDPTGSAIVGHVHFDLENRDKFSVECGREPAAGLFPAELRTYRDSPLYREVFAPFLADQGGRAIGAHPDDQLATFQDAPAENKRSRDLQRAIDVFGDVLGSIMAHEAGHALGLVSPGRPSVGLFGGNEGTDFAHNLDPTGEPVIEDWLMNPGNQMTFEKLAGVSAESETALETKLEKMLQFRPLNYAYLRDRVIVTEKR